MLQPSREQIEPTVTDRRLELLANGYAPIPLYGKEPPIYGRNNQHKGLTGWQALSTVTAEQIKLWERTWPDAANTGMLTRFTPTLDIDILNPDAAHAIEELARERFEERGCVLIRVGLAPKRAIPLRTDMPFKKITANVIAPNGDTDQKLELLADGQQVVVYGTHPKSGKPYAWFGGEPGTIKHENLPYVSEDEAKQFIADAVALLVKDFDYIIPSARPERKTGNGADDGAADWGWLLENIQQGRELHDSLRDLAGKLIASGMSVGAAVNVLRGTMQRSAAPHDDRWQDRYDDIPRLVAGAAQRKLGGGDVGGDGVAQDDEAKIQGLSTLSEIDYQRQRLDVAQELGIRAPILDKLVRGARAEADEANARLPHWEVEPWDAEVPGAKLLDDIERIFRRYIVLPEGASVALALWMLHAWTVDAGDTSPFLVLVSPTKRCGKTNTLIVLFYLTPRSELASNISASALFRYIEEVRPTLLIDEADSFIKDNEEMRGILNSGHTKTAAHVIRNVEINGEHKPRRFSTWAPKAIATIRALADTLEDRGIVVQLQRKPRGASVERLRKRDSNEFALLRSRAARWANDNFSRLTDPEPDIPEALNDRAADNWRPLLAIADLAGGVWPQRAREAASVLSNEGHDTAVNVELLADIRLAFGETDMIQSAELVTKLTVDPERPWAEWRHGKPLTQKQLAGLLRPFGIVSETVHPVGLPDAKGYKRARFEEAWEAYLSGQNPLLRHFRASEASKRPNADEKGTSRDFRSVQKGTPDGSKNANLANSHAGLDAWTDQKAELGGASEFDQEITGLTRPPVDLWADLDIPPSLRRRRNPLSTPQTNGRVTCPRPARRQPGRLQMNKPEITVERHERLTNRRGHELLDFEYGGISYTVGIGRFEDGRLAAKSS